MVIISCNCSSVNCIYTSAIQTFDLMELTSKYVDDRILAKEYSTTVIVATIFKCGIYYINGATL